jgi:hypothetical protein
MMNDECRVKGREHIIAGIYSAFCVDHSALAAD